MLILLILIGVGIWLAVESAKYDSFNSKNQKIIDENYRNAMDRAKDNGRY